MELQRDSNKLAICVWIMCGSYVDHMWIICGLVWIMCGSCVDTVRIICGSYEDTVWITYVDHMHMIHICRAVLAR